MLDYISLGDDQFTVEIRASSRLEGKTLEALRLDESGVKCLLIKHGSEIMTPASMSYRFQENDKMILVGTIGNLRKVSKHL